MEQNVAASTQNQALSALLFLYREVLKKDLGPIDALRARKPKRLPTVLTKEEVRRILTHLSDTHGLMARLLYGSGLRLMECIRLRVKDLDFAYHTITVHDGKGMEDRVTMLPESLIAPLQEHLRHVKHLHEEDLTRGYGAVYLPDALERKYPNANREWGWQYVFPSSQLSVDPRTGIVRRHHMDESGLQRAVRQAAQMAVTLVRRRGRYVQVGLFGKSIAFDLDQVVYRELTVTGTNASTPSSWLRALDLLRSGQVRSVPLITHVLPVTAWDEALAVFEAGAGVKTVFEPVG